MINILRHIFVTVAVMTALMAAAQRRVTPVSTPRPVSAERAVEEKNDGKAKPVDRTHVVERTDSRGNVILVDTLTGSEFVDSARIVAVPRNLYPKWNGFTVGVNVLDPFMRLIGQEYGGVDVWADVSLYNRYFPTLMFGVSQADITPDGNNFTFRSPLAPYFKIGCNYNMFYNNNPAYQFLAGLMYGFSAFSYAITDVTVDEGYWQDPSHFTIPSHATSAGWLEINFGVKVRIYKALSLGWNFKYHAILHQGKNISGNPMYVPGFGKTGNAVAAGFSVMYTIPCPQKWNRKADKTAPDATSHLSAEPL